MISRIPVRLLRSFKTFHTAQVRMSFASSLELLDKSKVKLQKIVEKELKYEKTNYAADETAKDFIDQKGFQVFETEGDNQVELAKQVGDVKVLVCFTSRPPSENEQQENEEQKEEADHQHQEGEQEEAPQDFADFTVYLTKPNGQTLCYECQTVSSEIQVNQVSIVSDIDKHKKVPRFQRQIEDFGGPEFTTLDERLQTALIEYLKGYGVNEELAAFIEHYSLDKEQRLYMQWLEQLTTYLKN